MPQKNGYLEEIQKRKDRPRNVLDHVEGGKLHFDIFRRILSHWPMTSQQKLHYNMFPAFPNKILVNIDEYLLECKHLMKGNQGYEQFELEFQTICQITTIASDLLPPPKTHVKRSYDKLAKKLKPITENLLDVFSDIDKRAESYVCEVIDKQVQAVSKEEINTQNILIRFAHINAQLNKALLLDIAESEKYFGNYKGGHIDAANRRAAIKALAEAFHLCFGEKPTTSEGGAFVSFVRAFIGWFENKGTPFEESPEVRESTLIADVKNVIKSYHSKS